MLLQDDRYYQILFLSLFLILGIGTRDWTLRPDLILIVILTCLGTQWLMSVVSCQWQSLGNSQANLSMGHHSCFFGCLRSDGSDSKSLAWLDVGCFFPSINERVFVAVCPIYAHRSALNPQCSDRPFNLGCLHRWINLCPAKSILHFYRHFLGFVCPCTPDHSFGCCLVSTQVFLVCHTR